MRVEIVFDPIKRATNLKVHPGFDFGDLDRGEHPRPTRPRTVLEPIKTLGAEAFAPSACGVLAHPDVAGDLGVRDTIGGGEHDPGSQHITVRAPRRVRTAGQDTSFFVGEDHDVSTGWGHIHF